MNDEDKALMTLLSGMAMHALLTRHGAKLDPDVVAIESVDYAEGELLQHVEDYLRHDELRMRRRNSRQQPREGYRGFPERRWAYQEHTGRAVGAGGEVLRDQGRCTTVQGQPTGLEGVRCTMVIRPRKRSFRV